ncbi:MULTISPECIES: methyltransferase domain-containing protein [unclassified Caballeronia]|uniref:methyltransferase domain-containing protein n=1 Tax=unclassified Caballeronia TaxID=2646786 RepID=UPI0028596288|nr:MULTISPECIES: methyltransferase domain-containing protein [unclassified Caballeronia]MDR5740324.1 methyltransferase domain-containing protein [Caballeronia sp. LZ016]MDR5808496.1 methyltransferase domain-containing protein [Caballeronia sp. LZ019]
MKETSKAVLRRSRETAFAQHYLVGDGLDIGPADDPLSAHAQAFPRIGKVVSWTPAQGSATTLDGIRDASLDFVHSSHLLAEQDNPHKALARWLDVLKPGGHAIVTLPDEDLYGKGVWPSRFNTSHKASFTICKADKRLPKSINVLELVQAMSPVADCERITLVRDGYDARRPQADQTADGVAECAIEIVLRKRAVPTAGEMVAAIGIARSREEGFAASEAAMRLYPYRFETYHRGLMDALRWDTPEAADALWKQCVERLPGEHLPRLYQALHTIGRGQLQEGFALRESLMGPLGWKRRTTAEPPRDVPQWNGELLAGKSIAIWSEFGLGDEIFFLRFAKIFRERCGAKRVVVVCQSPLVELYEASGTADDVIDVNNVSSMPAIDYWVFPHAIPAHLPLSLDKLPSTVPYLRAPQGIEPKLPSVDARKLKVGLVFKGNPTHENDSQRSLPSLGVLDNLIKLPGVEFFSLQKGAGADEAARYGELYRNFHDIGPALNTMAQTATAIEALDVVLTVDTSVAHVAGAMGKPVWLMLPAFGDWRWHYTREDSPWYPTMRLFRRRFGCDWSEVVARIGGHMRQLVMEKSERTLTA